MLQTVAPLQSKAGRDLHVLIIGRISTEHQDIQNIEASYRYVEAHLRRCYQGPMRIKHLGERASGMLVDRATIREAEDLIASGAWDVVIAEDLSRIFRNPRHQYNFVQDAVDAGTRLIAIADNLDTADPNWELMLGAATLRHGLLVSDTRRRVRRTATHSFHRGGMVMKVKFGYRKLTAEEAQSGHFGRPGLMIAKRPECTPVIRQMIDRVHRGESYVAVCDWLTGEGIETPPYSKRAGWTGHCVKDLLAD
ncbi:MAG: recombinase family protein, partial [Planctomycetota bacterium]|nr:recombinase family protein [Planctomycetota bacterium]